ncbi:MAG: hypothetical protein RMM06_06005 [Armatimonadota bacterium]|nr:hypothetical protein [bacterium]MCS7309923.1 hypothetical protein [Armatimonadota bacterium]MDW8104189.1 hypothetical protein [Armatimonadota bacterium]MDW8290257.1 hypothetical protein [Armatimonadota bacterium]
MKRWLWLLVAAGVLASWRVVDAQSLGRREGPSQRQPGNVMPQGAPAVPDASSLVLFASGVAPVALYALKRYRAKK